MMLEALCWDPTTKEKTPMSVCAMPIQHAYEGIGSETRGKVAMLQTIGAGDEKTCLAQIIMHSDHTHTPDWLLEIIIHH